MSDSVNSDRRASGDRRNPRSRRRHAESRRLHVELCRSVLRVALVIDDESQEHPLLRTRTVRWRFEADDLLSNRGREELAAALRQLVAEERLAGCSVSLAISAALCVNRATSGANTQVEQELGELKERSQLYLALGPGPKTTAIGRKQIDARHTHALVTVTNERTLRMLVEAAESAGLVVEFVESAMVSLARLQGWIDRDDDSAVILAPLDEDRFEIGVARSGQLLLGYRPAADSTVAQLGEIIDNHHERLIRFCVRRYGVGQVALKRMWLIGEPAEVTQTNARTDTDLRTVVPPLDRLGEFWRLEEGSEIDAGMGAALGLALRGRSEETGVCANLMDEMLAKAIAPIRPFLIRAAAPLAATLLVAATLWAVNLGYAHEASALRSDVEAARPAESRGRRLATQITDAGREIEQLSALVDRTPALQINPLIRRLSVCLPQDVWLQGFRLEQLDRLAIAGESYTEESVYDFVRHLEAAPGFLEVALRGTGVSQTPKGPATSFEIDIRVAPAMLAPRGVAE